MPPSSGAGRSAGGLNAQPLPSGAVAAAGGGRGGVATDEMADPDPCPALARASPHGWHGSTLRGAVQELSRQGGLAFSESVPVCRAQPVAGQPVRQAQGRLLWSEPSYGHGAVSTSGWRRAMLPSRRRRQGQTNQCRRGRSTCWTNGPCPSRRIGWSGSTRRTPPGNWQRCGSACVEAALTVTRNG